METKESSKRALRGYSNLIIPKVVVQLFKGIFFEPKCLKNNKLFLIYRSFIHQLKAIKTESAAGPLELNFLVYYASISPTT